MSSRWGHAESPRGHRLVFKHSMTPLLKLTLGLSIAKGSVNCEVTTVMLTNYTALQHQPCLAPRQLHKDKHVQTQTCTHRNNLYNDCSLINIQRWQYWLTFDLPSPREALNWPRTSSLRQLWIRGKGQSFQLGQQLKYFMCRECKVCQFHARVCFTSE